MEVNSLVSAIPKYLKTEPSIEVTDDEQWNKITSKTVYSALTLDSSLVQNKQTKWESDLTMEISPADFTHWFNNINKVTNVAKYHSFQYRLLHRAIITNIQLFHWGKVETNLCSFCKLEPEMYLHLFVFCERIQGIWIELEQYMKQFSDTDINFNTRTVITNELIGSDPGNIKNFICLVVKQYIYKQRCLRKSLSISELKNQIKNIERIEKYIAFKNGTASKHQRKWYGSPTSTSKETSRVTNDNSINLYVLNYIENMQYHLD